jgi:hypothetical protein
MIPISACGKDPPEKMCDVQNGDYTKGLAALML